MLHRTLSVLLVISTLACVLPMYISSATPENYDLPWVWPVPGSYVINGLDYYYSGNAHNQGQCVDIGNNGYSGDNRLDVVSSTSGEVFFIRDTYNESTNKGSGWGNYVVVKSGNVCIVYAHLKTVTCKYGKIEAGDVIGKMGNTGNSTGVHLHIQAYPSGESSSSTDIHIFDKFLYNPLYVPNFRFRSGVGQYSKIYGTHIQKYYTVLSGGYYGYAGGYDASYGEKLLGATVKAVRTDGARVYSKPIKSALTSETVENGKEFPVYGYYTDAYGTLWYLISEDSLTKWIPESDVGFCGYSFGAEFDNKSSPTEIYGSYFDIYFEGTVSADNIIETVRAELKLGDKTVAVYETPVESNVYEINNVFSAGFGIPGLENGVYTYELSITERAEFPGADAERRTYSVYTSEFTVDSSAADEIPPLVEDIKIDSMTFDNVTLSAKATDNKAVQRVVFTLSNASGFTADFVAEPDKGIYSVTVPVSSLGGAGSYTVTAKAIDSCLNTDTTTLDILIPLKTKGEVWKVQVSSSLTLRSGAATSYSKVGSLYNNNLVTITEIKYNASEKRYWGYTGSGWCAMEYTVYQSGQLYSITFNLLGGKGMTSTSIGKTSNASVTIPSDIPAKDGYTFLGWAKSSSASVADFKPGDTYSDKASLILYALWEDKDAPKITDITLSTKDYTSESVTLKVNASDNTGTVYYSFDGGESWRRDPSFTVNENTVIAPSTIIVKDAGGNLAEYKTEIKIENIDKTSPSLAEGGVKVNVSGKDATFTFADATDDLSGVGKYTLVYSLSADLKDATFKDIVSGDKLTLDDGVYYAKLIVSDKVGNEADIKIARFLVGQPSKLAQPSDFKVSSASSDAVTFIWNTVNDCDRYVITISESSDFTSALTFESSVNTLTVTTLEDGKVYYARVTASSSDGLYLDSEPSAYVDFETVSSDNSLYSFVSLSGVVITDSDASVTLPYSATKLDITAEINEKATVKYYSDSALTREITAPAAYSFTVAEALVYIQVTAENGDKAVYVLMLTRAAKDAEKPNISFNATGETIYVGAFGSEISFTASVNDGGTLSVVWYASLNGGVAYAIANGFTYTPHFDKPGEYKVYAVVTNTNTLCQNNVMTARTAEISYTVMRKASPIAALVGDYTYNGKAPTPSYELYNGDGTVSYKYYSDSDCKNEIPAPVNAGVYYLKAYASETDNYEGIESSPVKLEIFRLSNTSTPEYSAVMPSLRDRFGTLTVKTDGCEYSLNGGEYVAFEVGKKYTFSEDDIVLVRIAQTQNVNASKAVKVIFTAFSGTDGFYPSESFNAEIKGEYFIIGSDSLTADSLISKLEERENIVIYDENGKILNGTDSLIYSSCKIAIVDELGEYASLTIVILGDLDRNGKVDGEDVRNILMHSNGMKEELSGLDFVTADADGDGRITSLDAALANNR